MPDPDVLGRLDLAVVLLADALLADVVVDLWRGTWRPADDETITRLRRPWKDTTP